MVKIGNRLLISGLTSQGDTIEKQVSGIYKKLDSILKDYNTSPERVVKELVFVKSMEDFKTTMVLRKEFFSDQLYPSSSWIQVDRMFLDNLKVEIEFEVELI